MTAVGAFSGTLLGRSARPLTVAVQVSTRLWSVEGLDVCLDCVAGSAKALRPRVLRRLMGLGHQPVVVAKSSKRATFSTGVVVAPLDVESRKQPRAVAPYLAGRIKYAKAPVRRKGDL